MQCDKLDMTNAIWLEEFDKCNVANVMWQIQCCKCNLTGEKCNVTITMYQFNIRY